MWVVVHYMPYLYVAAEAERAGYGAVMVTVDSPRTGNREADVRNK